MEPKYTGSNKVWFLSIGFVLIWAGQAFAQEQENIESGRPDQTVGTNIVAPKLLQLETGLR